MTERKVMIRGVVNSLRSVGRANANSDSSESLHSLWFAREWLPRGALDAQDRCVSAARTQNHLITVFYVPTKRFYMA